MKGITGFILGNWPLKIGAVVLATILYGGVVLSQNTRTWPGQVPIDVHNPPPNAAVLNSLGYMTDIQYRAPLDVASRLTNGSFFASIDLANVAVPADGSAVEVPVSLNAVDASVDITDYQPKVVNVFLDPVVSQTRPVSIDRGQVPEGFTIGPPQVDPTSASITGARSRVSTVQRVVARVAIDASGLNVDQDVDLIPIDDTGRVVTGVQVDPRRAHVRIDVARNQSTTQLPVRVVLSGAPASGYEIGAVTVAPLTVAITGEAPVIGRMGGISTQPVDVSGRTTDFDTQVSLSVPSDVTVDGETTVMVHVAVDQSQASRTLEVALSLTGGDPQSHYAVAQPSVRVTLSGPATIVDGLAPTDVVASLDVSNLPPGGHDVPVSATTVEGVSVDTIDPATVRVDIEPLPTPAPSPTPSASPTPGPTLTPTAVPTPTATPVPQPAPPSAPSSAPPAAPGPSVAPSSSGAPAVRASRSPIASPASTAPEPTVAPEPTATADATAAPAPTATAEPTLAPAPTATAEPTLAPAPTATAEATAAPEATVAPTPAPESPNPSTEP